MTKAKTTKHALLMSVLSMMLCMAMLVSSTFAWFTDSVTSGTNRIVAGNLDVELYYKNASTNNDWADASAASTANPNFFVDEKGKDILWEPGVMAVTQFKVANVGSLALQYALETIKADCNALDGHDLSEVIRLAVIKNGEYNSREQILALKPQFDDFTGFTAKGELYPEENKEEKASEEIFTVVAYWEPNVKDDNLYNVNNNQEVDKKPVDKDGNEINCLYIDIDIQLNATQYTYEEDSFGPDYDEKALYQWDDDSTARIGNTFYKTLKEAVDAAQDNDTIMLYNGTLSDKDSVSINKNLTIIGTGNKESELNGVQLYVGNNVKLTLKNIHFTGKSAVLTDQTGNNEISINDCLIEAAFKHSAYGRAAFILGRHQSQATKLTIMNNTFLRYAADDSLAMAIFTWSAIQSDSVIQGNTFGSEDNRFTFAAIKIMNSANDGRLISLCDNEFYGTNDCWVVQLALQHDYNIKFLFKDNAFNGGGMAIDLDPSNGASKYTKTEVYISDGNTYNGSALTSDQVEDYDDRYSDNSINWGDPT